MQFNKKRIILGTVVVLFLGLAIYPVARSTVAAQESSIGVFLQALDIVKTQYVDRKIEVKDLIYGGIRGMLAALNDPYTRFLDPKSYTDMQVRMDGRFYGVGIQIGMKNNQITVISPIAGTPAAKAGVKALDVIKTVDGVSLDNVALEEAVGKIRGPRGTKVVLGLQRKDVKKIIEVAMIRDVIKIQSVTKTKIVDAQKKIGYIQLASFESKTATEEMMSALDDLEKQGVQGLILDVRNNGGGLLQNAIEIGSIFVKDGTIVSTLDRYQSAEVFETVWTRKKYHKDPLVVLINGASASASEILAGAIEDRGRGKLIGTHSFGKASVQVVRSLDDGSAILVTVAKYFTPKGTDINKHGIDPDIEVRIPTATIEMAMKNPDYEYNEKDDLQLQEAIKYLKKQL
jgi:carboxyl-terminal processing protease